MDPTSAIVRRTSGGGGYRPPLLLHSLAVSAPQPRSTRVGTTATASAAGHAALVAALLVVPLLSYDGAPEPGALPAFFIAPLEIQPPPPPPPPPPSASRLLPHRPETASGALGASLVAPVDVDTEMLPEEAIELGVPGGYAGGVEGGVPGGVAGSVVGGPPEAPPPPPVQPIRVGGHIQRPRKLKDVVPIYPEIARQARVQGVIILECTISPAGTVSDVKVLRGTPLLDAAAVAAVRQWVYTPTLLNGVPVPVVMTVTVTFRLR